MGFTEHLISTLGEEEIAECQDAFFRKVLDELGLAPELIEQHAEIKSRELPIPGLIDGATFRGSDDRVTELWVQDRTIATIVEIREAFNYSQVLMANYLNPELIQLLCEMVRQ